MHSIAHLVRQARIEIATVQKERCSLIIDRQRLYGAIVFSIVSLLTLFETKTGLITTIPFRRTENQKSFTARGSLR